MRDGPTFYHSLSILLEEIEGEREGGGGGGEREEERERGERGRGRDEEERWDEESDKEGRERERQRERDRQRQTQTPGSEVALLQSVSQTPGSEVALLQSVCQSEDLRPWGDSSYQQLQRSELQLKHLFCHTGTFNNSAVFRLDKLAVSMTRENKRGDRKSVV